MRRRPRSARRTDGRPQLRLTHALTSPKVVVVLLAAAVLFTGVLFVVDGSVLDDGIPALDARIFEWAVGHRSATTIGVARVVTWLGDLWVVAVIGAVFVVLARRRTGHWEAAGLVGVTVGGALAVTAVAKDITGRLRPEETLTAAHSLAFPSGHASRAAVFLLLVAWLILHLARRPVLRALGVLACAVMAIAVGWSRVLLGAHWPTDVLAGWALGVAWLVVVVAVTRPVFAASDGPGLDGSGVNATSRSRAAAGYRDTPGRHGASRSHDTSLIGDQGGTDGSPEPPRRRFALAVSPWSPGMFLAAVGSGLLLALGGVLVGTRFTAATPIAADVALLEAWDVSTRPWMVSVAAWVGYVGHLAVVAVVAAGLAIHGRWRWGDWRLGEFLLAVFGGSTAVTATVKFLTSRPRPDGALLGTYTSAFPSGHAVRAVAVYGLVCWLAWYVLRRPWLRFTVVVVAAAAVLLNGAARIALGVHWPSDIASGYVIGGVWLAWCVVLLGPRVTASDVSAGTPTKPGVADADRHRGR